MEESRNPEASNAEHHASQRFTHDTHNTTNTNDQQDKYTTSQQHRITDFFTNTITRQLNNDNIYNPYRAPTQQYHEQQQNRTQLPTQQQNTHQTRLTQQIQEDDNFPWADSIEIEPSEDCTRCFFININRQRDGRTQHSGDKRAPQSEKGQQKCLHNAISVNCWVCGAIPLAFLAENGS